MRDIKYRLTNINLIILVVTLCVLGLLMQYSASSYNALKETGDAFFYVKKQGLSMIIGGLAMLLGMVVNTDKYNKLRYIILGVSLALLAILFIPGVGVEKYGAKRWISLGFMTVQPSEISKFGLIFYIASTISRKPTFTFRAMIPVLLATGGVCLLIMLEPNMSITMLVALSMLLMLVLGGAKIRHFAIMAIPLIIGVIVLVLMEPYRMKRILAFIDPWSSPQAEGFQLVQSYYALSSGGLFGVGLFNSRQKYSFLPFAESDFIFAIIGEELGFVGAVMIICLFAYLIYLGIKTAMMASNRFDSILAGGITIIIAVQTILNLAVVTGSIPPTGLPLPFLSNGGTSLMVFMFATGVLVKINIQSSHSQLLLNSHKL